MGLAPPTGEYAEQMLAPDAWPHCDEDINFDRAHEYLQVLLRLTEVLNDCRHRQLEIFDGQVWSGSAAGGANRQVGTIVDALVSLQNGLVTVITWHRHTARAVLQAKSDIYDNVDVADQKIKALANEFRLTEAERKDAITAVIAATRTANAGVVAVAAEEILASKDWKPPPNALRNLLDQKAPPATPEDEPCSVTPAPDDDVPSDSDPAVPRPVVPPLHRPVVPPLKGPVGPPLPQPVAPGVAAGPLPRPATLPGWSPGRPVTPAASTPRHAAPGNGQTSPGVRTPAAAQHDGGDDGPAGAVPPDVQPYGVGPHDDSPRMSPASAMTMPAMPMAGAAGVGGGAAPAGGAPGGGAVPGLGGGPAGRMPSDRSVGVRPAAATRRPAPRADRVAHHQPTDAGQVVEGAAMGVIPVSAARLERDAVAEAGRADAERRSGADRLQLARRIAAALNAPVDDEEPDLGFFWTTGLTTDGAIVVANSYGLAYIPEGVQLPDEVFMATAEHSIPAAERASWVTYPMLAVQGWAAQRNAGLRAVIGTAEQLAESDPGAAKVVLEPNDIPDRGEMVGRSRLEVADPEAAGKLAQLPDARLLDMLPPPPAEAPADRRIGLWIQVMKPMAYDDPRRQAPHLKAFHAFVSHARDIAANEARAAADPVAQRRAIADWLYWKRLTGLLAEALSPVS